MKYFTQEYIKECDCEEIQGLKKIPLSNWDFVSDKAYKINNVLMLYELDKWTDNCIWLPTGDQLDEEIVKICKERFKNDDFCYYINYDNNVLPDSVHFTAGLIHSGEICFNNLNPLVAKIKLLKQLLRQDRRT
jgi:hypothetical protein